MCYKYLFIFIGEFLNNKKEGFGIIKFHSGDHHEGKWKNDLKSGRGESNENGVYFHGQWLNGLKHGEIWTYENTQTKIHKIQLQKRCTGVLRWW